MGILYERRHTKKIAAFGGVAKSMPVFSALFMVIVMASVGLPGLNGFVGEFLTLLGTSKSHFLSFGDPVVTVQRAVDGVQLVEYATTTPSLPLNNAQQIGPEWTAIFLTAFATLGVIFAAGYLLWMWRRVMFGPLDKPENIALSDVNGRELAYLVPIVAMAIFMGVAPNFFLSRMEPSVHQFLDHMSAAVKIKPRARGVGAHQRRGDPARADV